MKRILFFLLALLPAMGLYADDYIKYGDLYYNITSDSTVEVTYRRDYQKLSSISIPEVVTSLYDEKTYSVTSIRSSAFSGCTALTSITIPNSVTSIGNYAFSGCSGLTAATIGNGVTSIGEKAFYGCRALTSIAIPNSVTSIGGYAFENCIGLTSVIIPSSVTSIKEDAFKKVLNVVYNGTATGTPWGAKSINGFVDGYWVYYDDTKEILLACSCAATGDITIPVDSTSKCKVSENI